MPWITSLAIASRPIRRRVTPDRFKETYINRAIASCTDHPTVYVEIGVRDGESLRIVHADRKIGIDPRRSPAMKALRPGEEFFEMTSDAFFADPAPGLLPIRGCVDVALIDGLHEFSQALRDLLNLADPNLSEVRIAR